MTAPPLVHRLLTECDTMLTEIVTPTDCHQCATRYHHARHRITEILPGYPSTTPGNGSPGAGRGSSSSTVAERVDLGAERGLVLLHELNAGPQQCKVYASLLWRSVGGCLPEWTEGPNLGMLLHSQRFVQGIIRTPGAIDRCTVGRTRLLHAPVADLAHIVNRWGTDPPKPKPWRTDTLAEDLTEMWCLSCLRIGHRAPRWRGELCKWCYEFQLGEQFLPPPDILRARAAGRRITEAMVAPHRQRYRDRQNRRRKRR